MQPTEIIHRLRQSSASKVAESESSFRRAIFQLLRFRASEAKCRRVCDELQEFGLLAPSSMAQASRTVLVDALGDLPLAAPKAARLQTLARVLVERHGGSLEQLCQQGIEIARGELMGIPGVGRATADAILFRAGELPVMPVNPAIVRVAVRHGWVEPDADYEQIQDQLQTILDAADPKRDDVPAWLSDVGSRYCRRHVHCETCPLQDLLPAQGPYAADDADDADDGGGL